MTESAETLARSHAALAGLEQESGALDLRGRAAVTVIVDPARVQAKIDSAENAERTASQAEQGIHEAVSSVFSSAKDATLDVAFEYFKDYAGMLEPALKMVAKPYVGDVLDERAKKLIDWATERVTTAATDVSSRAGNALRILTVASSPPSEGARLAAAMETGQPEIVKKTVAELREDAGTAKDAGATSPLSSAQLQPDAARLPAQEETRRALLKLCQ